ncbi:glycosyltransferase [Vibrio hannami]|uniref:glycosyltransferase family 32 protein n=1 Tax=Vibrio hannami TaxID=2717094 RepID=UPI0024100C89|nr:glycosyltransferase [Vibrio hannami]MDG3086919.1 glycosyltransferase [Vibrio hannami]
MNKTLTIVANRLIRLMGNLFKIAGYPVHLLLPKYRFTIPEYSRAIVRSPKKANVTKIVWQTNYSNRVAFPVYINYLFNRLMTLDYEYRFVSDDAQRKYVEENTSKQEFEAYLQLNDGAALADFWRIVALNTEGGVYLDMDATLVKPLKKLIDPNDEALYVSLAKNNFEFTNFFLASAPNNPDYQKTIDKMVVNIEQKKVDKGVYFLTGPGVLTETLEGKTVKSIERKYVCIQGAFTNEHFQYLDKPRSKWIHKKPKDLLK